MENSKRFPQEIMRWKKVSLSQMAPMLLTLGRLLNNDGKADVRKPYLNKEFALVKSTYTIPLIKNSSPFLFFLGGFFNGPPPWKEK